MEEPLRLLQMLDAPEPLTLTFGVELECVLRFDPGRYTFNRLLPEESVREDVRTVFNDNGYPVYSEGEPSDRPGSCYEKWDVGNDSSINVPELWEPWDEARFGYCPMELRSPALPYTAASLSQVEEVFRLLFAKFDVMVNDSCGLHVHVGNEVKGFPLQTLKNFCILTTTFERELESLHPPSRINNKHAKSSGALFAGVAGMSSWDVGRIVKATHNEEDFVLRLQNIEKGYAYNLLNIRQPKRTIEFRQHEATVNVNDIVKWVELACGLVEKAHEFAIEDHYDQDQNSLRHSRLDDYLNDTYYLPNRSILNVLANLGLGELAAYYSGRGLFTHPRPV